MSKKMIKLTIASNGSKVLIDPEFIISVFENEKIDGSNINMEKGPFFKVEESPEQIEELIGEA